VLSVSSIENTGGLDVRSPAVLLSHISIIPSQHRL
jgi:hypothetical protein